MQTMLSFTQCRLKGRFCKEAQAVAKGDLIYKAQLPCDGSAIIVVAALDYNSALDLHHRAIPDFGSFAARREVPKV